MRNRRSGLLEFLTDSICFFPTGILEEFLGLLLAKADFLRSVIEINIHFRVATVFLRKKINGTILSKLMNYFMAAIGLLATF